jgi:hypothetical protein
VWIGPDVPTLTRIPRGAISTGSAQAIDVGAPLVALYTAIGAA